MNKALISELSWKPRDPEIQGIILNQSVRREDNEKLLLARICSKPIDTKGEHQKALGWNATHFVNTIKKLEAQQLIRSVQVFTGAPGKQPELLELTEKGRAELAKLGIRPPNTGRGGAAHRYYVTRLEHISKEDGFSTRQEYAFAGPGIVVDIYCWKEGRTIAIEVELSDPTHLTERISRLQDANLVDEIRVFSDKREIIDKAKRLLSMSKNAEFLTVQEFFKERRK